MQDDLAATVNYETLYAFVKEEMEKPSKLLETVAGKVSDRVLAQLPTVFQVAIKIAKINPPIGGKCKKASVSFLRKREG
jgi:dihydroneopterin aldolase